MPSLARDTPRMPTKHEAGSDGDLVLHHPRDLGRRYRLGTFSIGGIIRPEASSKRLRLE